MMGWIRWRLLLRGLSFYSESGQGSKDVVGKRWRSW